jgi:hypothetical protein
LVSTVQQKVETTVAEVKTAVAPPPPPPAPPETGFADAAKKPMSITGKFKPLEVSAGSVRSDLAGSIASLRTLANSGSATAALVSAPVADAKQVDDVKSAIRKDDDTAIREAIIAHPSSLNDLTPEQKGNALKRLEEGVVSPGDAYAMKLIVNSCQTKEELSAVVGKATGHEPPAQADFHKFDKQIAKHCGDPYLIADKLNPDNKALPTQKAVEQRAADAKKAADALDPNPSGSVNREQAWDPLKTKFVDKPLSVQKLEKDINVFVDEASVSARGSDGDVKKLVQEAKTSASGMDPVHGGDLMLRTADKLMAAGRRSEAKELLQELKKGPYAGIDDKLSTVADRKLAQCDQLDKMEKTLGRKVDPYDVGALRDYFQTVKAQGGMKAAGEEYNQFLKNFTKHPGGEKNSWEQNRADLDDPTKMASVMKNQTRDASGRMLLDCEGTTWLTGQIFGSKPKSNGNEVWITADKSHIAATVFDPKTGEGFQVNTMKSRNEYVTMIGKPLPKTETDRKATAWGLFANDGKPGHVSLPDKSLKSGKDYALTRNVSETSLE